MNRTKRTKKLRWIFAGLIVIAAVAGGGWYYWSQQQKGSVTATAESVQTTQVRRGSITLSASGSGTLIAGDEVDLAFPTSGIVKNLSVKVGDKVEEGQVLAELEDITDLEAAVQSAELDLLSAQKELDTYKSSASANLANAQLAIADAQDAYDDAKSALKQSGVARCDTDTTTAYYEKYIKVKDELDDLGDGGGNQDYYLTQIVPKKNEVESAYSAYVYCAGYTEYEISSSQANLTLAEGTLNDAKETLETLQANEGLDPTELAQVENTVASAETVLKKAKQNLAKATITAPFAGTILSIAGNNGDEVSASTFITLADLENPQVEFYVDETDFDKVTIGAEADVIFDALPDRTFKGSVVQIFPSLENSSGVTALKGMVQLNLSAETSPVSLPSGLTASVEIIGGEAENALLLPIEAIRDLGDGQYGVFVVNDSGEPRLTVVEVGLMDAAYAEIKSGVEMGDVVTTGVVETN